MSRLREPNQELTQDMAEQQETVDNADGNSRIKYVGMKEVNMKGTQEQSQKTKIEVREKKGLLRSAMPRVSTSVAWTVLFFNVFVPGSGTLILALASLCGVTTDLKKQNRCLAFSLNLCTAFLQTITAVIIVGWIWSVYWGMHSVTEANSREEFKKARNMAATTVDEEESKRLRDVEENENATPEEDGTRPVKGDKK